MFVQVQRLLVFLGTCLLSQKRNLRDTDRNTVRWLQGPRERVSNVCLCAHTRLSICNDNDV